MAVAEIRERLARERDARAAERAAIANPTRVITVRMNKSLHEALKALGNELETSLNRLCVTVLEAAVADDADPVRDG